MGVIDAWYLAIIVPFSVMLGMLIVAVLGVNDEEDRRK